MPDFRPAEVFLPGEYLADELAARDQSPADLARAMATDHSAADVAAVIAGTAPIDDRFARGLAAAWDTSAELWLGLQAAWDAREPDREPRP